MMFEAEDESFLVRFHPAKKVRVSFNASRSLSCFIITGAGGGREKKRQKEEAKKKKK